jgi:hypothetical protein
VSLPAPLRGARQRRRADGDEPLLIALALPDQEQPFLEPDVAHVEREQFVHADAGAPKHLQHAATAPGSRSASISSRDGDAAT